MLTSKKYDWLNAQRVLFGLSGQRIKAKLERLKNLMISMILPQQMVRHLFLKSLEMVVESGKRYAQ